MGLCVVCVGLLVHERHSIVGKAATQDARPSTKPIGINKKTPRNKW